MVRDKEVSMEHMYEYLYNQINIVLLSSDSEREYEEIMNVFANLSRVLRGI